MGYCYSIGQRPWATTVARGQCGRQRGFRTLKSEVEAVLILCSEKTKTIACAAGTLELGTRVRDARDGRCDGSLDALYAYLACRACPGRVSGCYRHTPAKWSGFVWASYACLFYQPVEWATIAPQEPLRTEEDVRETLAIRHCPASTVIMLIAREVARATGEYLNPCRRAGGREPPGRRLERPCAYLLIHEDARRAARQPPPTLQSPPYSRPEQSPDHAEVSSWNLEQGTRLVPRRPSSRICAQRANARKDVKEDGEAPGKWYNTADDGDDLQGQAPAGNLGAGKVIMKA